MRDVKDRYTRVHLLSAFLRAKDPIDKRERSEFPQYQTYQCYVRVVVLGVLGLLSFGPKNTALSWVPSPTRPVAPYDSLLCVAAWAAKQQASWAGCSRTGG